MSKASRLQGQFDEAAEQAKAEGVSSFGIGFNKWSERQLAVYVKAALERGVTFIVDEDGAGLFVFSC